MDDIFGLWDIRTQYDRALAERQLKAFQARTSSPEATPGLLKQIEARRHHDMSGRLHLILADTMVAHGIYDGVAPPENSEYLAEHITGAKLASFVGGHFFQWQDEHAWPAILNFLAVQ